MEEGKEGKGGVMKNKGEMSSSNIKYNDPFASYSIKGCHIAFLNIDSIFIKHEI